MPSNGRPELKTKSGETEVENKDLSQQTSLNENKSSSDKKE